MAWPQNAPLFNFNEFSVMLNAVPQFGVYALFDRQNRLIFIDAGDVQLDLLRLSEGGHRALLHAQPACFSFVLAPCEECIDLRDLLLADVAPLLNDNDMAAD